MPRMPNPPFPYHIEKASGKTIDWDEIERLIVDAVLTTGPERYTPPQVKAWAEFNQQPHALSNWLGEDRLFLARDQHLTLLGFAALRPSECQFSALYVHPDFGRCGIATALLARAMSLARLSCPRLNTAASHFSRPVFERAGFVLSHWESSHINAVCFHRVQMVKYFRAANVVKTNPA